MEASHILGGIEDEEHSSSESGWTMYIGSSINEYDHYNYVGEFDSDTYKSGKGCRKDTCCNYDGNIQKKDDESDDSMASDASSGPSNLKLPCCNERNLGMGQYNYKHETFKPTTTEKLHKQVMKRDKRRNKIEKEKLELKTISAASHVRSRDKEKVKISNCMSQEE